jgi:hypothetical protein
MRKSFILYKDSFDYLKELSDEDFGRLFKAIFKYTITGESMHKLDPLYLAFAPVKSTIDRDTEKYKTQSETNKLNGSKGGKRRQANATKRKRNQAFQADSDSDSVNDSGIDNEIVSKIKPSLLPTFFSWLEFRKGKKKPLDNPKTIQSLVDRFTNEPEQKVIWVINTSIENDWQGLFWDKYEEAKPSTKKPTDGYVSKFMDEKW